MTDDERRDMRGGSGLLPFPGLEEQRRTPDERAAYSVVASFRDVAAARRELGPTVTADNRIQDVRLTDPTSVNAGSVGRVRGRQDESSMWMRQP